MINGEERILYILVTVDTVNGERIEEFKPIACLTSNSFSESVEMLDTTTRISGGWKTARATSQSFNVDFEGLQIYGSETGVSYEELKAIKRARSVQKFKISNTDGNHNEVFEGHITDLSEDANVEEFISFSGSIQGFGEPKTYSGQVPATFDSTIVTFDDNNTTFDNTTT